MNTLFDIFNSISELSKEPSRRGMCMENKQVICAFFDEATAYIKKLQVTEDGKRIPVIKSRIRAAFKGYVINMAALRGIFEELVGKKIIWKCYTHII